MSERDTVERVIRAAYVERGKGDLDGVMAHFAPDAVFRIAGDGPVAVTVSGAPAIRDTMAALIAGYRFHETEMLFIVVEGSRAAIHWRSRVEAVGGGEIETEHMDMVEVRDDKILSLVQLFDTAAVATLAPR